MLFRSPLCVTSLEGVNLGLVDTVTGRSSLLRAQPCESEATAPLPGVPLAHGLGPPCAQSCFLPWRAAAAVHRADFSGTGVYPAPLGFPPSAWEQVVSRGACLKQDMLDRGVVFRAGLREPVCSVCVSCSVTVDGSPAFRVLHGRCPCSPPWVVTVTERLPERMHAERSPSPLLQAA